MAVMRAKITDVKRPIVMTVSEVADYLRVHPTTIYRMLKERKLPAFRVGADWRFSQEAIDQWQKNSTVDPLLKHPT
jgi:putative molybdopterin biosynthesis protein